MIKKRFDQFFHRVQFVDKLLFTRHLAIMMKSGISISEAMRIIADQSSKPTFKHMLYSIERDIVNGQQLHTVLSKFPHVFDPIYISLIKIGEDSGTLEKNLEYLAVQLKKNYDFNKKVKSATLYPTIVLVTAIIVGGGISFFVLPQLIELFESLDVVLPLSTQILLFISHIMKDYAPVVFGGIFGIFFLFKLFISRPLVKPYWHRLLLSLPRLGEFLQQIELAQLSRNLGIMIQSGLPITQALRTLMEGTTNPVYKSIVQKMSAGIEKGQSVEEVLGKIHSPYVPRLFTRMIGVGEKSGKLEESLLYLGEFFEDEVDDTSKNLSSILEPIILLGIGLLVAFVAFSVISPIYQLTGSIKK